MTGWPDEDWVDASVGDDQDPPPFGTLSATMVVAVTAQAAGDVRYVQVLEGGRVASAHLGDDKGADVTWTITLDDARLVLQGELSPSVAFMQGRLKTAGNPGLVLDVLAATAAPPFHAYRERLGSGGLPPVGDS